MIDPKVIFGRLGNSMFQYATLYAKARDEGRDFFFQDPKYFDKYRDEIKQLFGQSVGRFPEIGIHLRVAGNPINPAEPKYSENPFYCTLSETSYYEKAIALFPYKRFLVVSDDIEFAQNYFKGKFPDKSFAFSSNTDPIDDLNLFASCAGQIIANSSLSWWGAYLSQNYGKVICPSVENLWYNDKIIRTQVPKEWIQIEP